jgi:hypothetical protein
MYLAHARSTYFIAVYSICAKLPIRMCIFLAGLWHYPLGYEASICFALNYDQSLYTISSYSVQTLQSRLKWGVFKLAAAASAASAAMVAADSAASSAQAEADFSSSLDASREMKP